MLSIKKPRNARSKRALEKRQPVINEGVKTALFVTASHSSSTVSKALTQLSALKKPHAITFSKKKSNDVNPFVDSSSIEFLGQKNDAALMLVGDSRKKRKDNLTWIRLFDGRVLDMLEMGIDTLRGTEEFKPPSLPDIGTRPLFHFAGPQFAPDAATTYPAHAHLRSLLLDFYRGEEVLENGIPTGGKVALQGGLQLVISVTATSMNEGSDAAEVAGATLADLYASGAATSSNGGPSTSATPIDTTAQGSKIALRVYTITVPPKTPSRAIPSAFSLAECGPSMDLTLRRRQPADAHLLSQSLKRAKTQAEKNRQGRSDTYKKNIETDEMGDMVGRVHVGKQDLSKLQTRKMKGLKGDKGAAGSDDEEEDSDDEEEDDDDEDDEFMALGSGDEDEDDDDDDDDDDNEAAAEDDEMADLVGDSDEDDEDEPAPAPKAATSSKKRGRKA